MRRWAILVVALLVGAAAPAKAWCEATCVAATPNGADTKPHCPTPEPAPDGPALTAGGLQDCPVIESARPATAKIEFIRAAAAALWHVAPAHLSTRALRHQGTRAPTHPGTSIPLRI